MLELFFSNLFFFLLLVETQVLTKCIDLLNAGANYFSQYDDQSLSDAVVL